MAMVWSWKPAPSSKRSTAGMAASPLVDVQPQAVAFEAGLADERLRLQQRQRAIAARRPGRG